MRQRGFRLRRPEIFQGVTQWSVKAELLILQVPSFAPDGFSGALLGDVDVASSKQVRDRGKNRSRGIVHIESDGIDGDSL